MTLRHLTVSPRQLMTENPRMTVREAIRASINGGEWVLVDLYGVIVRHLGTTDYLEARRRAFGVAS